MIGTNLNLSFDVWYETLMTIAAHDYQITLTPDDKADFKASYDEGLTQYETLAG